MRLFFFLLCSACLINPGISQSFSASFTMLTTPKSCDGDSVTATLEVGYSGYEAKALRYHGSNLKGMTLKQGDKTFLPGDSIYYLNKKKSPPLEVNFTLDRSIKDPYLVIGQDYLKYKLLDTIPIFYGVYNLSNKIDSISISEACQDYILLAFPFVATQSDLSLYEYKNDAYERILYQTYYCCSVGNTVRIPKGETGRYKFNITGCYSYTDGHEFVLY